MANGRTVKEQLGVELDEPEYEPIPQPEEPQEERPAGLPDKFKDVEAFAESYRNLENELRLRDENHRREIDDLRETMMGLSAQQQPAYQQQQPDQQGINEQLYAAYENDPLGTVMFLANTMFDQRMQQFQQSQQPQLQANQQLQGEMMADSASRLLEAKYPDWTEYQHRVGELIDQNPTLLPPEVLGSLDATASQLESVYKQVKYDDLVNQLDQAREQQNDMTTMKRQAQTMVGTSGRPPEPSLTDMKMDQLMAAARGASYSAWRGGH